MHNSDCNTRINYKLKREEWPRSSYKLQINTEHNLQEKKNRNELPLNGKYLFVTLLLVELRFKYKLSRSGGI